MKKYSIWTVHSRDKAFNGVVHTTSFLEEKDALLFMSIIDTKKNYVSEIIKQDISVHENLASACDKWGF